MSAHHHTHTVGRRAPFGLALVITFGYAVIELAGGLWTGSLALLGDAGHMFSDALALGLAAVAAWLARRPPGQRHSYGWARAEVIGATLNSLLMLVIIVALVVEAVARLLDPRPVSALGVAVIALIGMAVNALVIWIMSRSERTRSTDGNAVSSDRGLIPRSTSFPAAITCSSASTQSGQNWVPEPSRTSAIACLAGRPAR